MVKLIVFIASFLFVNASPCIAGEIPFTLEKGFIIVDAKIKKDIPVKAAIFTGSADSFFGPDIIIKYKITPGYTYDGPGGHGTIADKTVIYADVPQIVLGDEKPVSHRLREGSAEAMSKRIGYVVDLILGADFFRGKIVQFDFKKKVIRFLEKPPVDYKQTAEASSGDTKPLLFKMDQSLENNFGISLTLPVAQGITFEGTKVRCLFDTAVASPISLSPATIKESKLGQIPDKGSTKLGQIKSMGLGDYEMSNLPALLFGKEAGFDQSIKDYGAIIGIGVMQNFLITFDWKQKMLVLQK